MQETPTVPSPPALDEPDVEFAREALFQHGQSGTGGVNPLITSCHRTLELLQSISANLNRLRSLSLRLIKAAVSDRESLNGGDKVIASPAVENSASSASPASAAAESGSGSGEEPLPVLQVFV